MSSVGDVALWCGSNLGTSVTHKVLGGFLLWKISASWQVPATVTLLKTKSPLLSPHKMDTEWETEFSEIVENFTERQEVCGETQEVTFFFNLHRRLEMLLQELRSGKLFREHRQTPCGSPKPGYGGPGGICCVSDLHSSCAGRRKGVFRTHCTTACANLIAVNLVSGVWAACALHLVSTGTSASLRNGYLKSISWKTFWIPYHQDNLTCPIDKLQCCHF